MSDTSLDDIFAKLDRPETLGSVVQRIRDADISGAKTKTDEELISFVGGGNDGDQRDAFAWGDMVREVKRRGLIVTIKEEKYNFY